MRHRWKWISALLVAAVVGLGWRLWQRPSPQAAGSITASPKPALAPAPEPADSRPAGISNSAVETLRKGENSDEFEICGVGKVKLDHDDLAATGKYLDALTKNSRLRWLAALRNSDDYRARATGLYLEGILDRDSPQKDAEAARDELVQLAEGTGDPAAFALAYSKCVKDSNSTAACPQLSLDDWTRADADNAVPWLVLAAKAHREGDGTAEAAAFAQAAGAHHYEAYNWTMLSFAQPAMPADLTAADRWILTTQVIGVQAAMPMPHLPFQHCSRDALSDATVHQQCNALAELMMNNATTLLDFSLGESLGKRVGWPAERVDKLTQELHASMQALSEMNTSDPKQQWSCDSVARGNAFMSQWVELGERALAGQAIERSGETVAELSREYDEQMTKTVREVQARSQEPAPSPRP